MNSYSLEAALADHMNVSDIADFDGQAVVIRYLNGRAEGTRIWGSPISTPSCGDEPAKLLLPLKNGASILLIGMNRDCKAIYQETENLGCRQEFPAIEIGVPRRLLRTHNSERACIFDRTAPLEPEVWVLDNKDRPELNRGKRPQHKA